MLSTSLPPAVRPRVRASSALRVALLAIGLGACGDSTAGGRAEPTPPPLGVDAVDDTGGEDADLIGVDVPAPPDALADVPAEVPDAGAAVGEACEDDDDCATGWCIRLDPRPEGRICLNPCLADAQCSGDEECVLIRNTGGDGVSVCLSPTLCIDRDGDGWGIGPGCLGDDCDDTRADVNPGADEICDGVDNDCDGRVDDRPLDAGTPCETGFLGACAPGLTVCLRGTLVCESDVADTPETCNGVDDDCDGRVDEGAGCFAEGDACVDGSDCETGLCVLGACALPVPPCHVAGTCPPRAALTSGGAERLQTGRHSLDLAVGGALPGLDLRTPNHHLTLGTLPWRNDP